MLLGSSSTSLVDKIRVTVWQRLGSGLGLGLGLARPPWVTIRVFVREVNVWVVVRVMVRNTLQCRVPCYAEI